MNKKKHRKKVLAQAQACLSDDFKAALETALQRAAAIEGTAISKAEGVEIALMAANYSPLERKIMLDCYNAGMPPKEARDYCEVMLVYLGMDGWTSRTLRAMPTP